MRHEGGEAQSKFGVPLAKAQRRQVLKRERQLWEKYSYSKSENVRGATFARRLGICAALQPSVFRRKHEECEARIDSTERTQLI
jgi:hypothetical protein